MMNISKTASHGFQFGGFFGNLAKSLEDYRLYIKTVKELSALTDRELDDLNISRWDIDRIARQAVASR